MTTSFTRSSWCGRRPESGESLRTCRVACPTMTGQHCIAQCIAAHGVQPRGRYAVDAGGPSGEPPAGPEIVPVSSGVPDHGPGQGEAEVH